MGLKSIHWVFFNEGNPDQKIAVQDQASAQVLAEVLRSHADVWVMKEEFGASAGSASPKQAPAQSQAQSQPFAQPAPVQQKPMQQAAMRAPAASQMQQPVFQPQQHAMPMQHEHDEMQDMMEQEALSDFHDEEHYPFEDEAPAPAPAPKQPPAQRAALQQQKASPPPMLSGMLSPPPAPKVAMKEKEKSGAERRRQKRFKVALRIILISRGKSFRSISQDVSLGGMRLRNHVPAEFLNEKCVAYISNLESKENIEVVCQVISDPNDPSRLQFLEAESQQLKRLSQWLVDNDVPSSRKAS